MKRGFLRRSPNGAKRNPGFLVSGQFHHRLILFLDFAPLHPGYTSSLFHTPYFDGDTKTTKVDAFVRNATDSERHAVRENTDAFSFLPAQKISTTIPTN